MTQESINHWST